MICKAVSASELFELGLTHDIEHKIDTDNEPDFDKPFVLETYASDFGVGGALLQATETIERPVAFFSNHLNRAKNYGTGEKKLQAIVSSVEHFSQYLYPRPFKIRTAHRPFTWMLTTERPASRIARWLDTLSGFEFTIEDKPGKVNYFSMNENQGEEHLFHEQQAPITPPPSLPSWQFCQDPNLFPEE